MSLFDVKKQDRFIKAIQVANSERMLLALDKLSKPSTLNEINAEIHQIREGLSSGQMRHTIGRLLEFGVVKRNYEKRGEKTISKFDLTSDGRILVEALKKFLKELEVGV